MDRERSERDFKTQCSFFPLYITQMYHKKDKTNKQNKTKIDIALKKTLIFCLKDFEGEIYWPKDSVINFNFLFLLGYL